jgi:alpha-L-rhamnosidase
MAVPTLTDQAVRASDLRVEHVREPLGLWTRRPRFSWIVVSPGIDAYQDGYELEVRLGDAGPVVWSSGRVASGDSVLVPYRGPDLRSATRYEWRVRVSVRQVWSGWATSIFETSLLDRGDWVADFVEPKQAPVTADGLSRVDGDWRPPTHEGPPEARLHPAKYLRQDFLLRGEPVRARLWATARGVYTVEVNGVPASDEVLAPGYESYDKRLSFQVYDVTPLVRSGENTLGVILGDGWYAGRIDFTGSSAQYGDMLQAGWQLLVEYANRESDLITPDVSVRSCDDGPIRYSDIFIGERHDAGRDLAGWSSPGFDATAWTPARLVPAPQTLAPFVGEPIRRVMELPACEVLRTPAGDTVVDFGQVIAGRVRLRVTGPRGAIIKLEHTETLDSDGDFFINIVGLNKDQTDYYVLAGDPSGETWEPTFTFHGFRYVRLSGYPGEPTTADFTAIVVASDLEPAGDFACSDDRITKLHRNVVWSQRSNFLAIPTDCPQRERVGWTGDLQVFALAATRNMKVISFLRRWLDNVRLDQAPDGRVPVIVPSPPMMSALAEELVDDPLLSRSAAAGWSDAIVIVPWVLFQRYSDRRVLEENYAAMRAWVERQIKVAESELPVRLRGRALTDRERDRQKLLWNSEPNFGDWLAPSVKAEDPTLEHMLAAADRTGEMIGAMFHGHSTDLLARVAAVLGFAEDEERYRERARLVREAVAEEYMDRGGRLSVETQGTYVLALALGMVPEARRGLALERLVDLIHAAADHLDTGFLSVPFLLDVLSTGGEDELARTLLWQSTPPSWLYAIDRGATSIWEEWSAIAPDGRVGPGSLNHYAFGSVDEWLYGRLAGLQPTEPGFRRVRIAPDFDADLRWVEAYQDTPYGRLSVRWQRDVGDPGVVRLDVTIPPGMTAEIAMPNGFDPLWVSRDNHPWAGVLREIGSGLVTVSARRPDGEGGV